MRYSEDEYAKLVAESGKTKATAAPNPQALTPKSPEQVMEAMTVWRGKGPPKKRAAKYNAKPCFRGEERFDSEHEAKVWDKLCLQVTADATAEAIGGFPIHRQVSLRVGSANERIRPDFMLVKEVFDDGSFRAELLDAKGFPTPAWKAKQRRFLKLYGLKIREV